MPSIQHAVVPRSHVGKFDCDVGESTLKAFSRLLTKVREPGDYSALLVSDFGELSVSAHHGVKPNEDVRVQVGAYRTVHVRCTDESDAGLADCIIFTSGIEPLVAWSIAMCESRGYTRMLDRQTTRSNGSAQFPCQLSQLDPAGWTIFSASRGLCRPSNIEGSADEGYIIKGLKPLAGGSLTVTVGNASRRAGVKYYACVTPVYTNADGGTSQALVGLGQMIELAEASAVFDRLPVGDYMLMIVVDYNGNFQPAGPDWTKTVSIKSGESVTTILPQ